MGVGRWRLFGLCADDALWIEENEGMLCNVVSAFVEVSSGCKLGGNAAKSKVMVYSEKVDLIVMGE